MIELVLCERDGKGEPTSRQITKSFERGDTAAVWYDKQRGHNLQRENDNRERPIISQRG